MNDTVRRDERTVAIENASYRWGYLFVSFAVLLSSAYRGFVLKEASWDLFAIVVLGGVVTTAYQSRSRILTARWVRASILVAALALAVAFIFGWLARR
jgi:hypothetical protein